MGRPDLYTDIGLPPNQGRDGAWNTNNWSESAFKTFDSVFLDCRQNKRWAQRYSFSQPTHIIYFLRIDRLASTVLDDFLPYYQYWRPRDRTVSKDVINLHFEAYTLWDTGAVSEIEPNLYGVQVIQYVSTVSA